MKSKTLWVIFGIFLLLVFIALKCSFRDSPRLAPSAPESADDPFQWLFKQVIAPTISYWFPATVKSSNDCSQFPEGIVRSCSPYGDNPRTGVVCQGSLWTSKVCDKSCLPAQDASNGLGYCEQNVN